MRKNFIPVFMSVVFLLSFAWLMFPQPGSALTPGPIYFKDTGAKPPAWFSHVRHLSYALTCNDCHLKIFKQRIGSADLKGAMTMQVLNEGKFCGACHNGKDAFTVKENCNRCHIE